MIAAVAHGRVIGKEGVMPWHMPADLRYFKRVTLGHHIIMGRKTFESFGAKPLPKRVNVVITRNADYVPEGIRLVHGLGEALSLVSAAGETEAFIIGGGTIYREALPLADRIYLTRISTEVDGDTFFPELDRSWSLHSSEPHLADDANPFDYVFEVWTR
jgi:dihydrofolate reductase